MIDPELFEVTDFLYVSMVVELDTQVVIYLRVYLSSFIVNGGNILALIRRYFDSKGSITKSSPLPCYSKNIAPHFGFENFEEKMVAS